MGVLKTVPPTLPDLFQILKCPDCNGTGISGLPPDGYDDCHFCRRTGVDMTHLDEDQKEVVEGLAGLYDYYAFHVDSACNEAFLLAHVKFKWPKSRKWRKRRTWKIIERVTGVKKGRRR